MSAGAASPENWCEIHACRWRSPKNDTRVDASSAKLIGRCASVRRTDVEIAASALPRPASIVSTPSGSCAGRRTAYENGSGRNSGFTSLRWWNSMYALKSADVSSLPIASTSCVRSMSSM